MKHQFPFTYKNLKRYYEAAINEGYRVVTCNEYCSMKDSLEEGIYLVNRVDIDMSPRKALRVAEIFGELGIKATFFIRLHADDYNPYSFENFRCLKFIRDEGHEIGLHTELVDASAIWDENGAEVLKRDIATLEDILQVKIKGTASHGGTTGLNNLDFWKEHNAQDFDLRYEAYDNSSNFDLFNNSFYISDSCWTYWKCYDKGRLMKDDNRTPDEHFRHKHPLVYMLIHPVTYYDEHFHE